MSQQLAVCLVAVVVNLGGTLVIYAVLASGVAKLARSRRGIPGVILGIIATQLFWIAPALLVVVPREPESVSSYALWFGNWLVGGFSLLLFWKSALRIPTALDDAARLDGLGALGTWKQTVFPFVRRDLILIAIFTLMATLLPFWGLINQPDTANVIVLYQRISSPAERVGLMLACSLLGALPLIAILFAVKRQS